MGAEKDLHINFVVPQDWDGNDITFKARLQTESVVGDAIFELHYARLQLGDERATKTVTQLDTQKTVTVPATPNTDFEVEFTDTPTAVSGDILMLRLRRRGSLPGDDTGTVRVSEFFIEYESTAGGGGSGESNTASNIGGGAGIFSGKTGVNLAFRTLTSPDSSVGIAVSGDNVQLITSPAGETNTGSNLGTGAVVFSSKVSQDLQFRTLTTNGSTELTQSTNNVQIGSGVQRFREYSTDHSITAEHLKNSFVILNTSANTVELELPEMGADDDLTQFCVERSGTYVASVVTFDNTYKVRYANVSNDQELDLTTDGDSFFCTYRHSNKTFYFV